MLLAYDPNDPSNPHDNTDSCYGDSGGALFLSTTNNDTLIVGIVPWGVECDLDSYPGVYTRVSHFENWIQRVIH